MRALRIREKVFLADHVDTAQSVWWFATLLAQAGDKDSARAQLRRAVDVFVRTLGADHPITWSCQRALDALDAQSQSERTRASPDFPHPPIPTRPATRSEAGPRRYFTSMPTDPLRGNVHGRTQTYVDDRVKGVTYRSPSGKGVFHNFK
jgi:hypothetical protein